MFSTVQELMSPAPPSVDADATIDDVLDLMLLEGCPSVFMLDTDARPVGIVTEYDVLKVQSSRCDRRQPAATIASACFAATRLDQPIAAIALLLRDGRWSQVAVLDDTGRLAGVLLRRDVMRALLVSELLGEHSESPTPAESLPRVVPPPRFAQSRTSMAALQSSQTE